MASPAENLMGVLVTAGVGVIGATSGWSLHLSKLPNEPDTSIALYDTGGLPANPKYLLDFPSIQVFWRGSAGGYQAAMAKGKAIKDALLGLPSQALGGDNFDGVIMISDIAFVAYDQADRPTFSLNFRCFLEPAAGTNRTSL